MFYDKWINGLVFYKKHPALDVDSMKIYEYLASGLPVVSTGFHEHLLEDFDGLLCMGNSIEMLEDGIKKALDSGNLNINKRMKFLEKSDWKNRAEEIVKLCMI